MRLANSSSWASLLGHVSTNQYVHFLVAYIKRRKNAPQEAGNAKLAQVVLRLESLNRSTELDFLAIGARLVEFLEVSDRIAKEVGHVVETTAVTQGDQASAVLERSLERCRSLVATTTGSRAHLASLRARAVQVGSIFGSFRQAVASFHVVCTMTRIEAARLGGGGEELGSLTDQVLALAHRMESQIEDVLTAASAVDRQVEHIAAGLRGTDTLLDHLALTIPDVLRNLDGFSAQQAAAIGLSTQLAAESKSVFHAIMGAVTSIQFHDITRQQIEHVTSALDHLAKHPPSHDLSAALQLESMQLASANSTFAHSVARLWNDLGGIATSVHGMASHGEALVRGSGNDSTFFLEMQHCLDAIVEGLTTHRTASTSTRQAAHALAMTLDAMNRAAAEIRVLDVHLLRVALNANIHAAHLGPRGDTLAVLASALQDLATRAQERSRHAAIALEAMDAAVTLLGAEPAPEDDEALTTLMRSTMETLQATSAAGTVRLGEIASSAAHLAKGIATARDGFHAGRLFEETIPSCRAQLQQLAAEAPQATASSTGALATFARRYTMQSERDIHAAAVTVFDVPLLVAAGDAELGDNVELF